MASRRPDTLGATSEPRRGTAAPRPVSLAARSSPRPAGTSAASRGTAAGYSKSPDAPGARVPRGVSDSGALVSQTSVPRLLGVREAASYLGVSPRKVHAWRASGVLRPVALPDCARLLFDRVDLDAFVERSK